MVDGIRERGRYYDIIIEALLDYDEWMKDDDYNSTTALNKIMKRMRERLEMSDPPLRSEVQTIELMARESDAEIARITGLLFDQINENKAIKDEARSLRIDNARLRDEAFLRSRDSAQEVKDCGKPREPTPLWQRRWPHDQPNGWNLDSAGFLAQVQANPMLWLALTRAKYLEMRIDTRDGGFNLYDRDGKPLNPDDVIDAIAKVRKDYGGSEVPSAHQSAPSDSSSLPSGESDPSATTDFLGAGTGDNAASYGNSPREIQKRAMKARTSAISSTHQNTQEG